MVRCFAGFNVLMKWLSYFDTMHQCNKESDGLGISMFLPLFLRDMYSNCKEYISVIKVNDSIDSNKRETTLIAL